MATETKKLRSDISLGCLLIFIFLVILTCCSCAVFFFFFCQGVGALAVFLFYFCSLVFRCGIVVVHRALVLKIAVFLGNYWRFHALTL